MGTERPVLAGHGHSGVSNRLTRTGLRARTQLGLRVAGAGLLIATAAIHLDLYLTGYRSIPTIGWLFLLQVIVGFGLGLVVLASGDRLAAAAAALFALATLGGYLLTLWVGLFGFQEVRTTSGIAAGVIEIAAFATLAGLAAISAGHGRVSLPVAGPVAAASVAAVSVAALAVLGGSVAAAGAPAPASTAASSLKTTAIGGVTVLTNAKGLTLYWFAPDTATKSNCNGTCVAYWPPVKGPATAGAGVTGRLSTIKRADGSTQATYDGHPLYTYVGDSSPGQANGNRLNLNGGLWYEVTASAPAA
jgi:predicted lipoprotein with Yx(FWY)xxD motif